MKHQKTGRDTPSDLRILSYNLKFHKAYHEVEVLAAYHNIDIVCLQECYPHTLEPRLGDLVLVGKTVLGRAGQAVYCREGRFTPIGIKAYSPSDSLALYERLRPAERNRLLIAELHDNQTGQRLFVASFHAIHLVATNRVRRQQIEAGLAILRQLCKGAPAVMVGDYNYPLFKSGLRRVVHKAGYKLHPSDKPTYKGSVFIKGHFDLASSINTSIAEVSTLPFGPSDHAPILIQVGI